MKSAAGLTLVELMMGVAIGAITLGVALPSVGGLLERQRLAAAHNVLHTALNQARTVAITKRKNTVVCPSSDGDSCRFDGVWESGWRLFVDANANGQKDAGEADIARHADTIDQLLMRSSVARPTARFMPTGRSAGSNMSIRLCSSRGKALQALIINNGGRVRRSEASENAGLAPCAAST